MTLTEKELYSQNEAMQKTYTWFQTHRDAVQAFFRDNAARNLVFMGCGSSFMLSKSGEQMFGCGWGSRVMAIAGGDYLIAPEDYRGIVQNSIVVLLSRSGLTTEIVRAAQYMRAHADVKILAITMREDNGLSGLADLEIVLPWAYDASVCQTRTVSNLYASLICLRAFAFGEDALFEALGKTVEAQQAFLERERAAAIAIAQAGFSDVVVLADGALCGIAEEGALAFTEIAMVSGKYFHLLDYRHGPKVLNNAETLNIVLLRGKETQYQPAMVKELKALGGKLALLDDAAENRFGADLHIRLDTDSHLCAGIPLINLCQMIAFERALVTGSNPDQPNGLSAYISLDEDAGGEGK